jgi:hypothetical protein
MLVSQREASRLLERAGLTRNRSRRLLASGMAGEPVATAGALLYEAERISELAARPVVSEERLMGACPGVLFVARRDLPLSAPCVEPLAVLAGGWPISSATALYLDLWIERHGYVPLVATICGFVAAGAEIVGVTSDPDGTPTFRDPLIARFDLRGAGDWFDVFEHHRLDTGPGRAWSILGLGFGRRGRSWPSRPTEVVTRP